MPTLSTPTVAVLIDSNDVLASLMGTSDSKQTVARGLRPLRQSQSLYLPMPGISPVLSRWSA